MAKIPKTNVPEFKISPVSPLAPTVDIKLAVKTPKVLINPVVTLKPRITDKDT